MNPEPKIIYLCTTFPKLSETFVQREVRELVKRKCFFEIYSLWRGEDDFEGVPVHRFHPWKMIKLVWKIPIFLFTKPRIFRSFFSSLTSRPIPSLLNAAETLMGFAFALCYADHFSKHPPDLFHGTWATMPSTAAQVLSQITGIPFSMEAHAYDLYENGGDSGLPQKLAEARFIRTSTKTAQDVIIRRGAHPSKVFHIRRGLSDLPPIKTMRTPRSPIRILSVGRLIEKKGFFNQLEIYRSLQRAGIPFSSRIVGSGPLRHRLKHQRNTLGLEHQVKFLGAIKQEMLSRQYAWADIFLFTGIIASNGDRDGFPNVIAEAMAAGVPVLASNSQELTESLTHHKNAVLLDSNAPQCWKNAIKKISQNDDLYLDLQSEGRKWVEKQFDIRLTINNLHSCFGEALSGLREYKGSKRTPIVFRKHFIFDN